MVKIHSHISMLYEEEHWMMFEMLEKQAAREAEEKKKEEKKKLGGGGQIPVTFLQDRFLKHHKLLDITEEEAEAVVYVADLNNDHFIDYDEFRELMNSKLGQSTRMKRLMTRLMPWPKKLESFFISMINFGQQVWNLRKAEDSPSTDMKSLTTRAKEMIMFLLTGIGKCWFILSISILQVVVFFMYYNNEHAVREGTECPGCSYRIKNQSFPGPFIFTPEKRTQVWRFASYMFLHSDWPWHLIGNVFFQLLFGIPFEITHKFWRTASLYVLAVIAGALLQYSFNPGASLVGASAGVYALITAHFANVVINYVEKPIGSIVLCALIIFYNLVNSVLADADECDISHSAHIAGAIVGFCFASAVIVLKNLLYTQVIVPLRTTKHKQQLFSFLTCRTTVRDGNEPKRRTSHSDGEERVELRVREAEDSIQREPYPAELHEEHTCQWWYQWCVRWLCAIVIVFFFVGVIAMTILRPPFARPLFSTNKNCPENQ